MYVKWRTVFYVGWDIKPLHSHGRESVVDDQAWDRPPLFVTEQNLFFGGGSCIIFFTGWIPLLLLVQPHQSTDENSTANHVSSQTEVKPAEWGLQRKCGQKVNEWMTVWVTRATCAALIDCDVDTVENIPSNTSNFSVTLTAVSISPTAKCSATSS